MLFVVNNKKGVFVGFVELGVVAAMMAGPSNLGFKSGEFQRPYLLAELPVGSIDGLNVRIYNESRTYMKRINVMNPSTALWRVGVVWRDGDGIELELGHQSEHRVSEPDKLGGVESYDYVKAAYRWQL